MITKQKKIDCRRSAILLEETFASFENYESLDELRGNDTNQIIKLNSDHMTTHSEMDLSETFTQILQQTNQIYCRDIEFQNFDNERYFVYCFVYLFQFTKHSFCHELSRRCHI